ncbi:MAG: hypothetical protein WEB05_01265 [Solirubrobacterales bacterium]
MDLGRNLTAPGALLKRKVASKRKDLRMASHHRRRLEQDRRTGLTPGSIACLPGYPSSRAMIVAIAAQLGLEISPSTDGARAVFFWQEDWTSAFHEPPDYLVELARTTPVVNIGCTDISKTTVSRRFEEVFGNHLLVDPRKHRGPAVEKTEKNGLREVRLVECPTEPAPGHCYQRLIDNRLDENWTEDIRPVVIGGSIACLIRKVRPIRDRFGQVLDHRHSIRPEVHEARDYLSADEVRKVLRLAASLGADYCEIDCLRDRPSGRLYAVDVNTTPAFFNRYQPETRERMIEIEAEAFSRAFL